jgi:hypothetical protein
MSSPSSSTSTSTSPTSSFNCVISNTKKSTKHSLVPSDNLVDTPNPAKKSKTDAMTFDAASCLKLLRKEERELCQVMGIVVQHEKALNSCVWVQYARGTPESVALSLGRYYFSDIINSSHSVHREYQKYQERRSCEKDEFKRSSIEKYPGEEVVFCILFINNVEDLKTIMRDAPNEWNDLCRNVTHLKMWEYASIPGLKASNSEIYIDWMTPLLSNKCLKQVINCNFNKGCDSTITNDLYSRLVNIECKLLANDSDGGDKLVDITNQIMFRYTAHNFVVGCFTNNNCNSATKFVNNFLFDVHVIPQIFDFIRM